MIFVENIWCICAMYNMYNMYNMDRVKDKRLIKTSLNRLDMNPGQATTYTACNTVHNYIVINTVQSDIVTHFFFRFYDILIIFWLRNQLKKGTRHFVRPSMHLPP